MTFIQDDGQQLMSWRCKSIPGVILRKKLQPKALEMYEWICYVKPRTHYPCSLKDWKAVYVALRKAQVKDHWCFSEKLSVYRVGVHGDRCYHGSVILNVSGSGETSDF